MLVRLVLLSFVVLGVTSTKAVEGIRFDRMHIACNDKSVLCEELIMQIKKELYFATLVQKGSGFSELWLITMHSAKARIEQLKRDFPGVWEAQDCPLGDCWDLSKMQKIEVR